MCIRVAHSFSLVLETGYCDRFFGRLAGGGWSGFSWLRIGTSGGLLWTRWWTFWFWRQGDNVLKKESETHELTILRIRLWVPLIRSGSVCRCLWNPLGRLCHWRWPLNTVASTISKLDLQTSEVVEKLATVSVGLWHFIRILTDLQSLNNIKWNHFSDKLKIRTWRAVES
jgi:hypothetical protein